MPARLRRLTPENALPGVRSGSGSTADPDPDTPTTRCYPRSTREAFADERRQWLEMPKPHKLRAWAWVLLLALAGWGLVLTLVLLAALLL
jgi:hypothetical protein